MEVATYTDYGDENKKAFFTCNRKYWVQDAKRILAKNVRVGTHLQGDCLMCKLSPLPRPTQVDDSRQ